MRCEEAALLLSARLDGELTVEEERELNEHLAQCAACRALADDLSALHLSFGYLEDEPAPEGFAAQVMDRVRAAEGERKVLSLSRRPLLRAAAGLVACAVLCIGLYAASRARKWEPLEADFQATARAATETAPSAEAVQDQAGACSIAPQSEDYEAGMEDLSDGETVTYSAAASPASSSKADACLKLDGLSPASNGAAETGAVLVLTALPEGAEDVLSPDAACSPGPGGGFSNRYPVTREQFEALAELARAQELILEQHEGDGSSWTVEVQSS